MPNIPAFPQPILDAYKNRTLAVLFGSGLSLAKDVTGNFPSWDQLPVRLLARAAQQAIWTPSQIKNKTDFFTAGMSLETMLAELDSLKTGLGSPAEYRAALTAIFRPPNAAHGDVHRALAALDVDAVLTTNYDRLHEAADTSRVAYTWLKSDKALADIEGKHKVLYKIHGTAEDDDSVIMTRVEYNAAAANLAYQHTMRHLLQSYTFLLVGYGINDPLDLDLVFGLNKKAFGSATKRHYALMKDARQADRDRWSRDMNIQVIPYADHAALPAILRALAQNPRNPP